MADYQEKIVNLDVALERKELLGAGVPIESLYVNGQVPGGVQLKIHFGARAGLRLADFAAVELCPGETQGVFVTTIGTAPGQSLSLILGTGLSLGGTS